MSGGMSLINEIRNERDPWLGRFEEHRKDENAEAEEQDEEVIRKRRAAVGVILPKEEYLRRMKGED